MKNQTLMHAVALVAALGAGSVLAQTRPSATDGGATAAPVVTDAGPAPAQERSSMGAIVLENSPVRAQRENFERASASTATMGNRGVMRSTLRNQREADQAQAREDAAVELYRRGAGALDSN